MRRCAAGAWLVPAFFLGGFVGAGCGSPPGERLRPTLPNADYRILLSTQPVAVQQLDPTQFTVHVTEAQGKPVKGAVATVQIAMPTMDMGRNEVGLHEVLTPPGTYVGSGRFTMPGDWQVVVQVDKNGKRAEKTVSFTVR